jgi:hypothetical protein
MVRTSDDTRQRIAREYARGDDVAEVADRHGVSGKSVRRFARAAGIPIRNRSIPLVLNEHAFDISTEAISYWIGFLLAAAHFPSSDVLELTKKPKDRKHVEALAAFLGDDRLARLIYGRRFFRVTIRSRRILEALAKFGIVANRPRRKVKGLENDRHFWRGLVDGGGTIHLRKRDAMPLFHLRCSQSLLKQFRRYFSSTLPRRLMPIRPSQSTSEIQLGGQRALRVLAELYRECSVYLPRKQDLVERARRRVFRFQKAER